METQLEAARRIFREFHIECFWYCPPGLAVGPETVPFILHGLRSNGGTKTYWAAQYLRLLGEKREDADGDDAAGGTRRALDGGGGGGPGVGLTDGGRG